ncbi:MAG: CopD family protein [Burkholderiaceae bacterium]|nr:CopD family protein [Burkholderiaceae bacterium]
MYTLFKFFHLVAAVVWLGGMSFMLLALRPSLPVLEAPPQRLKLLVTVLRRFFAAVWAAVGVLLLSGTYIYGHADAQAAPLGWHLMSGIGVLMFLVFGHLYFSPWRRLQQAVAASDWPAAAGCATLIARLVSVNFVLGWLAVAAIVFLV